MASESWRQQLITNRGLQSGLRSNLLAGAAGDNTVPRDGDLAEDGEGVARDEGELRMTELGVRHKLGKPSVITGKILLECVLAPASSHQLKETRRVYQLQLGFVSSIQQISPFSSGFGAVLVHNTEYNVGVYWNLTHPVLKTEFQ